MASMKEIREHIASIQSTQKVTNAMYLIASTKMRVSPLSCCYREYYEHL